MRWSSRENHVLRVADPLERADIGAHTADGSTVEAVPLTLGWIVSVVDVTACTPLEGVVVALWHCDADGAYSGVSDPGFDTTGHDFLRGAQRTDARGKATFQTIYPEWYSGRAVHIHFKIRTDPDDPPGFDLPPSSSFQMSGTTPCSPPPPTRATLTQPTESTGSSARATGPLSSTCRSQASATRPPSRSLCPVR
jgi:hypothetical protein